MADRLEQQIRQELDRVASSANPPADAWERFVRRTDASGSGRSPSRRMTIVGDPVEGEGIDGQQPPRATEFTMQTDSTPFRPRRRLLLGAVAALGALGVAGVALAVSTQDDDDDDVAVDQETPVTTIELSGAEGNDAAASALGVVGAAYEGFNSGDPWQVPRNVPGGSIGDHADRPTEMGEFFELEYALGAAKKDVRCEYVGYGEYTTVGDEDVDEPVTGHRFECSDHHANALTEASGVEIPERHRWLVDDGRVVYASKQGGQSARYDQFLRQYGEWLFDVHPDVAESLSTSRSPFEPSVEDAPVLLDYVDEFVEQSDDWPIDES